MGTFKISCAQKEFVRDLTTCELEGLFEEFYPFLAGLGVMLIQPVLEGTVGLLKGLNLLSVVDRRVDLQLASNDPRIL